MDLRKIVDDGNFDLHLHTTASDGDYSPDKVVEKAREKGITTIAITDHDSLKGLDEAINAGRRMGVNVIRGIELSSKYKGKTVDILGYNINSPKSLENLLEEMKTERETRTLKIIEKFNNLGLTIKMEDIKKHIQGDVIARPHIAKAIVEKGYVKDVQTVFDLYLADGKPCSVDKFIITPSKAINMIHKTGGEAVLAHPKLLNDEALVLELLKFNFDGIEVWHRKQNRKDNERYAFIANKYNLIMTGGSDFHNDQHQIGEFGFQRK
nr:PHP domain-containing protein [Fredinandcohnia onubensis]